MFHVPGVISVGPYSSDARLLVSYVVIIIFWMSKKE